MQCVSVWIGCGHGRRRRSKSSVCEQPAAHYRNPKGANILCISISILKIIPALHAEDRPIYHVCHSKIVQPEPEVENPSLYGLRPNVLRTQFFIDRVLCSADVWRSAAQTEVFNRRQHVPAPVSGAVLVRHKYRCNGPVYTSACSRPTDQYEQPERKSQSARA